MLQMSSDFEPTQWTLILRATDSQSGTGTESLKHLCHAYWSPLFAYVRSQGASSEDAEDTVQSFFRHLIESQLHKHADRERGRFRTFLLMSLRHFVSRQQRDAEALKRGGGSASHVSLEQSGTSLHSALTTDTTPDALFDKKWALNVLEQALLRLEAEQQNSERFALFKPLLQDDERGAALLQGIGPRLGMTDGAVRTLLSRLRARYRELIREEVGRLVENPSDLDDEIRHLMEALRT